MKKFIFPLLFFVLCNHLQAQTSWELTGNAGTDPANNFLGTTDNKALVLRTKNISRLYIGSGGKVGIGTSSPLQKFDVKGNINIDSSWGYYINNIRVLHTSGLLTFA